MITLEQLCEHIHMPAEVTGKVLKIREELDFAALHKAAGLLKRKSTWTKGLDKLKKALSEDPDGLKLLTCMLVTGLSTYEDYLKKGIGEEIYYATFGCFSRFVNEYKVSYGHDGFDRGFWAPRQLSMMLFRIGELEYEFFEWNGQKVINMHIPSDVVLTMENCRISFIKAKEFLSAYYPDYKYTAFVCDSWLLSPNLKEVLQADSRILQFQNSFTVMEFNPEAGDYLEWVFKNRDIAVEDAPEDTSLQRRLKAFVLNGGKVGCAFGVLEKDPFV